jgi:O-antigen/teichoic acid export membrane protein
MSLVKKLAGETVIYGLSSILPRLLQYLIGMTYLTYRFEDQQQVGIYTTLYGYTAVILTILLFRLDTAYFRYAGKDDARSVFSTAFFSLLITTVVICGLAFWQAEWLTAQFESRDNPQYIRWFAMIIGFDTIAMLFYARFRYEQRPLRFLAFRLGNVLLYIMMVFLFLEVLPWLAPDHMPGIAAALGIVREIDYTFVANLFASIVILLLMLPQLRTVQLTFDWSLWRKMIRYAWPLVVVGAAGVFTMSGSAPLQELYLSDDLTYNQEQVGIYGAAAKVALILNLMIVAFNYAAEPFFFKHADDRNKGDLYGQIAHLFTIVICAAVIGVVAYLDVIKYVIAAEYRSALHVVPYLLFAFLLLGLYYNVSIWYKLSDKTLFGAAIALLGMVIMVSVNVIYLPRVGVIASAYAVLACYSVMLVVGYLAGQHYYPIKYPVRRIGQYIFLTAILTVGIATVREADYSYTWLVGTIALVIFAAMVYRWDQAYLRGIARVR